MSLRTVPEMLNVSESTVFLALYLQKMCSFCNAWSFFPHVSVFDKHDNELTAEEEEQRAIAKIKMLGNIKFIGELGKLNLIHESILHKCIKTVGFY